MTQATASPSSPTSPIVDVLIIGAGLSGVGMACHLKRECPDKSLLILERRKTIGGTWDLFRYPGIRSDSDMFTFGFKFRPWNELKVLADGPSIRQYVNDTARDYGIDRMIRFGLKTTRMEWSDAQRLWTVTALDEASGQTQQYRARYLVGATGYYNYDRGYEPAFPGRERFQGQVIHPQHWPESLDYRGKRVVVIGSGATAVTLVPAMADQAADTEAACTLIRGKVQVAGNQAQCVNYARGLQALSQPPADADWGRASEAEWRSLVETLTAVGEIRQQRPLDAYYTNDFVPS